MIDVPPHWPNPWQTQVVNVPLLDLAECLASGYDMQPDELVSDWSRLGPKLDAYVFKELGVLGFYSVGIRYGSNGPDYLSPYANPKASEKIKAMILVYSHDKWLHSEVAESYDASKANPDIVIPASRITDILDERQKLK